MKERPTSVTVFAIINLVLCGLGLIGMLFWILKKMGVTPQPDQENPFNAIMANSQGYILFEDISNILGILATILLIAASIAMFSLKPWSRITTIALAVYSSLMMIAGTGLYFILVYAPAIEEFTGPERTAVMIFAIGFPVVILSLVLGYYLLMIFMLSRPHVVDAFTPEPLDESMDDWDAQPSA